MTTTPDKLIHSEIKPRNVTYYLTTEEDLRNARSNSLFGDVFVALASLSAGGIISVILTRATAIQLEGGVKAVLNLLLWVFIIVTTVFAVFAVYFHYQSFAATKRIKGSGVVTSLKSGGEADAAETPTAETELVSNEIQLEILQAEYRTPKAKLDVTEELRKRIVDNRLELIASNDIKGDPEVGVVKKLAIKYKFAGIVVTKEFTEGDKVVIP